MQGTVKAIKEFGFFVELPGGRQGLVHIGQVSKYRIESSALKDVANIGDMVWVKVLDIKVTATSDCFSST